jgi:prevent-host-death family protein
MNMMPQNQTTRTASQARKDFYNLIRKAGTGLQTFEITLQGSEPAILMSKSELESWRETIDILSQKEEINNIRTAKKQKQTIPHKKMLQELGIE